jgi:hypothetical protein
MHREIAPSYLVLDDPVHIGDRFMYEGRHWIVAQTENISNGQLVAAAACEYCPKGYRLPRNTRYRIFRCQEETFNA